MKRSNTGPQCLTLVAGIKLKISLLKNNRVYKVDHYISWFCNECALCLQIRYPVLHSLPIFLNKEFLLGMDF